MLFHLAWPGLLVSAVAVFIAMHRNLFGPSGENMYLLEALWAWGAGLFGKATEIYPVEEIWSAGNWLRPAVIGFCVSYLVLLFLLRFGEVGNRVRLRNLLIVAGLVGIPLLVMPNIWSSDVFDYIVYGRLPVIYHSNPYLSAVCEYPADVFYNMTCWKSSPSVYGPAWSLLSVVMVTFCALVSAPPPVYVFMFKLLAFVCHLFSGALIWKILSRAESKTRAFGTAVYLFSPLALIEFAGNAHNESFLIAMLLLGIAFAQRGRWALASVAFTVAVQTKFYVLPILCIYAVSLWWREADPKKAWMAAAGVFAVFAGLSFVLYLPFGLHETTILAPLNGVAALSMTKSLGEFFVYKSPLKLETLPIIGGLFIGNHQEDVQRMALLSTFFLCVGCAAYARSLSRAVTAMALYAIFWSAVGATWFMPWYLTVAVALAPLSGSRSISIAAVLASMLVFIIYLLEGWSYSASAGAHNFMVQYFQVFVFGPSILVYFVIKGADGASTLRRICTLARNPEKALGTS